MSLHNQVRIWIVILVATVVLLWVFRGILLPFVVGMALAYLLNPLVNLLQRARINRGWATAIVLFVVLSAVVWAFFLIVPLVVQQVIGLAQRFPDYVTDLQALANQTIPALNEWLGPERAQQLGASIRDGLTNLNLPGITANITAQLASSGLTLINFLTLAIITPVVAFYLLLDWESMVRGMEGLMPRDHRSEIKEILHQIDKSMAGVIRGQGSVVLILAFFYSTALSLSGLNFGLSIGLITGLLSFVPYVGFASGLVLSVGIALVQFWPDWFRVAIVLAIFLIGQFLEGNILYPKLVGSSIGINPVWLMFSLFATSLLFGFVGLLLAVPLSAIAAVLLRYAVRKYKESPLYLGQNGGGGGDPDTAS